MPKRITYSDGSIRCYDDNLQEEISCQLVEDCCSEERIYTGTICYLDVSNNYGQASSYDVLVDCKFDRREYRDMATGELVVAPEIVPCRTEAV